MKLSAILMCGLVSVLAACKGNEAEATKLDSDSTSMQDSIRRGSPEAEATEFRKCSSDTSVIAVIDIPFSVEASVDSLLLNLKEKRPRIESIINAREGGVYRQFAGEGQLSSKGSAGVFVSCDAKDSAELVTLRSHFDLYRCDAEDEPRLCGDSKSEFLISRAQAVVDSLNLNFKSAHASVAAAFYLKLGRCLDSLEYSIVKGVSQDSKMPIVFITERSEL